MSTLLRNVGKSHKTIARWISLLKLQPDVQNMLDDPNGIFTPKHAGEILKLKDVEKQLEVARLIEDEGLSVAETKTIVKEGKKEHDLKTPVNYLFTKSAGKWIVRYKEVAKNAKKLSQPQIGRLINDLEKRIAELQKIKSSLQPYFKGAELEEVENVRK